MARATVAAGAQAALFASAPMKVAASASRVLPVLQRRGDTAFFELPASRMAAPGTGVMVGTLTVNPYVGCEMSCSYCYAPYAHGWLTERLASEGRLPTDAGTPTAFDRAIFVKRSAEDVVAAVVRNPGAPVCLGTATDPYQPAERRFGLTRGVLERLAGMEGLRVSITTKSPLVLRDMDLLDRIRARSRLTVHVSLISTDARLLRAIEPRSPTPQRRLDAVRRLRERGIRAGIFAMPLLPGLTDGEEQVDALFAAAREVDACFVVAGGVRFSDVSWKRFLPMLQGLRPDLVAPHLEVIRGRRGSPRKKAYGEKLDGRISRARARHGFAGKGWAAIDGDPPEPQLSLL